MIVKNIKVPTGNICIYNGDRGYLEFLSISDYGKEKNIKADFLGLTNDINGVPNGDTMPLEEKWVITISTQYGCPQKCKFCEVPKIGFSGNATVNDMKGQLREALLLHPEVKYTKRLNIHLARMGEPSYNWDVLKFIASINSVVEDVGILVDEVHPVVTTMMPNIIPEKRKEFIKLYADYVKNFLGGEAGLQLSINSTCDKQRRDMFGGMAMELNEISEFAHTLDMPVGRKYTLNFALADGYEIDAIKLRSLFDPMKFIVKITPIHQTASTVENGITTTGGYEYFTPYKKVEQELKDVGFDVLVFIPSTDEDESKITCGNLILSTGGLDV